MRFVGFGVWKSANHIGPGPRRAWLLSHREHTGTGASRLGRPVHNSIKRRAPPGDTKNRYMFDRPGTGGGFVPAVFEADLYFDLGSPPLGGPG